MAILTTTNQGLKFTGGTTFIQTGTSNVMSMKTDGNIGISVTSPLLKLHITGTNSLPATSGTAPNGGIRIENGVNNGVLDIGASNATGAPGWIQSTDKADLSQTYNLLLNPNGGNVGIGTTDPFSPLQVGNNTFNGTQGMVNNSRVGISNHGSLTGLMLASTYNDASYPEYGVVFVQGPSTSSYNVWSISPDGPAKGGGLSFIYQANSTNIHNKTPKVYFDGTNSSVGIGTITPSGNLSMNSQIHFGVSPPSTYTTNTDSTRYQSFFNSGYANTTDGLGPYPRYFDMVATGSPDGTNGGSNLRFFTTGIVAATGAQERMRISSAGNVGIGTISPIQKLDIPNIVVGGSTIAGTYRANALFMDNNGGNSRFYSSGADGSTKGSYEFNIMASDANPLQRVLVIDNLGNVGIGEDNPSSLLHLKKATGDPMINIQAVASGDPGITFTSINNRTGNIFYSDGTTNAMLRYDHADVSFKLYAHNTTVADFVLNETTAYFPTQNVGIGTTLPLEKLQVNGNIYAQDRVINANVTNANENLLDQDSIKISNKNDIYSNTTRVIISPYEATYTQDGTAGSTTLRLSPETDMTAGDTFTFSIYYKDLVGFLSMDIVDTGVTGPHTSATGTAAAPTSGRIYGTGVKPTTAPQNAYNFVDINLSNSGVVTLLNPKLETGGIPTEFVATTEEEGISQTLTTNNLRATGSIQMGADDTVASADKVGTMRYRTATDEPVPVTGTELVTGNNGNFAGVANGTDVTTLTMWYAYGTVTSRNVEGEKLKLVTTQTNTGARIDTPTTIGSKYQLTFTASGDLGVNGIHISSIGNASTLTSQPYVFTAIAANTQIYFRGGNNAAGTTFYDNIQLIEITEEDASYADMCMQTGSSTYEWVNIVRNTY